MRKPVPDFPGYEIDDQGVIWSSVMWRGSQEPRALTPCVNQKGYLFVRLYADGKVVTRRVHQLVTQAFIGPRLDGMEVRHLNGVKTDNRLANLTYGTPKENGADKRRLGEAAIGERCGRARLTADIVIEIRRLYAAGWQQQLLADRFGVTRGCVHSIVHNRSWAHLPSPPVILRRQALEAAQ